MQALVVAVHFDGQCAALRHGIARVEHEIEHHLLELTAIGEDPGGRRRVRLHEQLHIERHGRAEQRGHVPHQCTEVHMLHGAWLLATEREQLPCQA